MNSEIVDLVATDPPFNKSRDFHATPDSLAAGAQFHDRWSWQDDIHDDWLTAIMRDEPEVWRVISTAKAVYGDDMAARLWLKEAAGGDTVITLSMLLVGTLATVLALLIFATRRGGRRVARTRRSDAGA